MNDLQNLIGIDPGSAKCGVAVINSERQVLERKIVLTGALIQEVQDLIQKHDIKTIVMGKGTGSRPLQLALQEKIVPLSLVLIDENFTTLDARERYYTDNPPRGLARLIPASLRAPNIPIDDYVATLLAERYLDSLSNYLPR